MKQTRLILAIALVLVLCPLVAPATQDDEVLSRVSDESAASEAERERALATLLTAARELRARGELMKAAGFLNRAGRLQIRLNHSSEALATYAETLKLQSETVRSSVYVDTLNGLAAAYAHLSKCDDARDRWREAASLSEGLRYIAGKAEALLVRSHCENYGDHSLAVQTARESLELWQSTGEKSGIARAHSAISDYQIARHNLTEATASTEAALQIWRELSIPHEQAEALTNLGFIEQRKGNWQEALQFFARAQSLFDEKAEPYQMGRVTAGIGESFLESGLPENGLQKFQQAREYYRQAESPRAVAAMTWQIGQSQYLLGDYQTALTTLQQALQDAASIKEPMFMALCHDFLGRTYYAIDDAPTALIHFETAVQLYIRVGSPKEAASARALIGQVYQKQGKIEKARQYYQNALKTFQDLSDQLNESAAFYALGNLELQQNNLPGAENYLQRSIELTENIRRVSTSSDLTAAFSATVHARYERYIECLLRQDQRQPDENLVARAFQASESARGRSLSELLRATQTNLAPGIDAELARREKELRQALRVREDYRVRLLGSQYKKEELDALSTEIANLEAVYKRLNETIRQRFPSYDQIVRPESWTLKQIQDQVIADDDTTLLEYSLGTDVSYVWAITRNSIASYELPAQDRIEAVVKKVYSLLKNPEPGVNDAQLTLATAELSQMILAPVAAQLIKRQLIVVADGPLHYIPFQVLPLAGGEPLIGKSEVVNAPSASILGQLKIETAKRAPRSKVLTAFGNPVFASNYAQQRNATTASQSAEQLATKRPPNAVRDVEPEGDTVDPATLQRLFFSTLELENLREVAGAETSVVTGFEASRENLAKVDLSNYEILHIATHGYFDPKHPEKSGLFLSTIDRDGNPQNGFVALTDIYSLHAPVDLVVLSACRTGLGKEVRGEGLIGLTRGFMYAGASSVVASLWKVDDEATSELMKRFYANMLQRHMTPAAALQAAQNSIRQEPQWRSPYFWAAFTLQGEHRQTIQLPGKVSSRSLQFFLGTFVALLLVTTCWWVCRSGHAAVR